uniref:Uncharacterized protein n=1 Tax=Arundo donax TaxID=35708 RepID=A0A0A9FS10_ARUDO
MRVLGYAIVAVLVLVSLLSSSPEARAVRLPAVLADHTSDRSALPPVGQPRRLAEGGTASASASLDASKKPVAAGSSSPSTVFDPDRMSKRRVRRGSDPIHNKC